MLAAAPSVADASVAGVVAAAKAGRARLVIGHGGNGTLMHLTAQMFNQIAGTQVPLVPYKGTAAVVTDLLGGHIALGIVDPPAAGAALAAGKLKMVGISSATRYPQLKGIPTFMEQGLKDFESFGWFGMVAPAGTPPAVIARLNEAIVAELKNPVVIDRIHSVGSIPMPQTPAEFAAFIQHEIDKWTKVVAASGGSGK
jgi:tripartite-type tricarboxylate transporter receptor subunit TctC